MCGDDEREAAPRGSRRATLRKRPPRGIPLKRILLVGARWYGQTTESVARALRRHGGHVTVHYDDGPVAVGRGARLRDRCERRRRQFIRALRGEAGVTARVRARNHSRLLALAERETFNLMLVLGGDYLAPATVMTLARAGRFPLALWLFDDPFIRWGNSPSLRTETMRSYAAYDQVFVFDAYYLDQFRSHLHDRVSHLPLAADDELYQPLGLERSEPVVFVGAGYPSRRALLAPLAARGLALWGPQWAELAGCVRGGTIPPEETNRIYNRARIILNLNHPQSVWGTNARTFEVPAAGGFLLTDERRDLGRLFRPETELVTFRDGPDLREKVDHYLRYPEQAAAIATAARERVRREHTYAHRMATLLARCGLTAARPD